MATPLILKRGLGKWFNNKLLASGMRKEEHRIRVMESLYERIGETGDSHLKFLGEGMYAAVGWLQHDRKKVLKITADEDDAMALETIRQHPSKFLVKVHDVFRITPPNKKGYFGIVEEKLTPLAHDVEEDFFRDMDYMNEDVWGVPASLGSVPDLDEAWESLEEFLTENKYAEEWQRGVYGDILKQLEEWNEALYKRDIAFHDLSPGNVMMRRHAWVLMDFGHHSRAPYHRLPQLDIIRYS